MNPLIVNALTFLGVFFAVFAANAVLADIRSTERKRLRRRVEEQLRNRQRERARSQDFEQIVKGVRNAHDKAPLREWLDNLVEQSGLNFSAFPFTTGGLDRSHKAI